MISMAEIATRDDRPTGDQIVHLDGVTWEDFERLLAIRGDRPVPRFAYLNGVLELMSPSKEHESIKSLIGRLVEVYCEAVCIEFAAYGSWTIKDQQQERGAEPDECYVFGTEDRDRPDLAIEVEWTSGRIEKLEVYRKLGVREVWFWRRGRIQAHALRGDDYEAITVSEILPQLDLELLASFLDRPRTSLAMREFRAALESKPR
jgi:Uma2 family endonuclease